MALTFQQRFSLRRFFRGEAPKKHDITLDQRRVFILPNKAGFTLAAVILLMLVASINYNNSMGFVFTFFVAAIAQLSTFYSYRNLSGLNIRAGKSKPCFLGKSGFYTVYIKELEGREHWAVSIKIGDSQHIIPHIKPHQSHVVDIAIKANTRGWFSVGTITLFSTFPFDIFKAWSPLQFEQKTLVYPSPLSTDIPYPVIDNDNVNGCRISQQPGADEFIGFRRYQKGDPFRKINWKAVAAQKGTFINQFSAEQTSEVWLDWHACLDTNLETRLSQLCRWVIDAQNSGVHYGLKIPSITIKPGQGEAHQYQCLKALALYNE